MPVCTLLRHVYSTIRTTYKLSEHCSTITLKFSQLWVFRSDAVNEAVAFGAVQVGELTVDLPEAE